MTALRAALVGTGWWGKELAKAAQGVLSLSGFFSADAAECSSLRQLYGGRVYESYAQALADCEAVILATPHSLHAEQVVAAAAAGRHVFVEKPLALDVASGRRALEACENRGRVLAVGHNRRFAPAARRMKTLIDSGACGRVLHVEANYSGNMAMRLPDGHWRTRRAEMPAAGVAPMGLHMIDTLQWLAGPVRRLAAIAKRQAIGFDLDDTAAALFELESGATGTLASHLACPLVADLRVLGTAANLEARGNFSELACDGRVERFPEDATLREELAAFAASCRGGAPYPVTPLEALRNVAVMEAMRVSAERAGAWTMIPA